VIDRSRLPTRACVDNMVLVLGLGESKDPRAPACRAFFEAMEETRGRILIAAPTLAEYLRNGERSGIPRVAGIEPVAFDDIAATVLARELPRTILKQTQQETGLAYDYIKYDAMIVACAKRHRAEHFVTLDRQATGLAERIGLKVRQPSDYEAPQLDLPRVQTTPPTPTKGK
jgi:predicted nucleic acid-binding protein